jgi:uncharacterized protein (UPF0332 family)
VNEKMRKQLRLMIEKASDSLQAAKMLLEKDLYDNASSRAYYAVFHMMQAALVTKGLSYSSHSGVINGFSRSFIKTGILPKHSRAIIRRLRREREVGDYSYEKAVSQKEAKQDVESAQKLFRAIEDYLKDFLK